MDSFLIEGGVPLKGTIAVSGSKNAALPIIMAAIAVDGDVTFTNVPDLRDVKTTIKLLNILGRESVFEEGAVSVKNGEMRVLDCLQTNLVVHFEQLMPVVINV